MDLALDLDWALESGVGMASDVGLALAMALGLATAGHHDLGAARWAVSSTAVSSCPAGSRGASCRLGGASNGRHWAGR